MAQLLFYVNISISSDAQDLHYTYAGGVKKLMVRIFGPYHVGFLVLLNLSWFIGAGRKLCCKTRAITHIYKALMKLTSWHDINDMK